MNSKNSWQNIDDESKKRTCCFSRPVAIVLMVICILFALICAGVVVYFLVFQKNSPIKSVTSVTEVFPEGQKVKSVSIEYSNEIDSSKLTKDTFSVEGRNITNIYTSSDQTGKESSPSGKYVIISLNTNDSNAYTFIKGPDDGDHIIRQKTELIIQQKENIFTSDGKTIEKSENIIKNDHEINLIVDDFKQFVYKGDNEDILPYNLYIPKNYSKEKKYPLIMFIHDAGNIGNSSYITLIQGIGATIWASPEEQQKHESFVLAPQTRTAIVNDDSQYSGQYTLIMPMIQEVLKNYPEIDTKRIYTTGQSMGCMTSISLICENRNFFATALLVAGQWSSKIMKVMVNDTFWILISEGDDKASKGMNAAMAELENLGANITRAVWNGEANDVEKKENVAAVISQGNRINYIQFKNGTVVPDMHINDHMGTWKIAYSIEGVRDWVFEQSL